jgi:chromosomal replication initiator protein
MINPFLIMKAVENEYFLKPGSITKPNRRPRVAQARAVAMHLVRETCNMSYPEIGEYFDRDHTTVIHNCKKVEKFAQDLHTNDICRVIIKLMSQIGKEQGA